MAIDVNLWEAALRNDHRLNDTAKKLARMFAEKFRDSNGHCQLSADGIANAAGVVSLPSVRENLSALQVAGWLGSANVVSSPRFGKVWWATMSSTAQRPVESPNVHRETAV
jgi:hypothetical protein